MKLNGTFRNLFVERQDHKDFRRDSFKNQFGIVLEAEAFIVVWMTDKRATLPAQFFKQG